MPTNTAGRGALLVSIAVLDLDEKTSFNSTYKARLVLDVTVTKPGSREACWTGRVDGQANNYGEAQQAGELHRDPEQGARPGRDVAVERPGLPRRGVREVQASAPPAPTTL